MIDYHDALQRLLATANALPAERIDASDAGGRILAASLAAGEALPPFDNSAMDGFAVQCGEAPLAAGVELDVEGSRAAGDGRAAATCGAWEIMTGAPVPAGLDAVVPVEQVTVLDADADGRPRRIRLDAGVARGQHVRHAGADVAVGQPLAEAGTRLGASHRMVCAALGIATVDVRRRPRVAVINTGRELVDQASMPLEPGRIRNSNGPFLAARLEAAGAELVSRRTVGDEIGAFLDALAACADVDAVVSTGAVSMGRFDFVPEALSRLGAATLFHKVRIRPGKPILAARLPSGAVFFGLPGNPASTAVGLRFFVEPVIRAMLGLPAESFRRLPLREGYAKRVPLRMHLKARVELDAGGRAHVTVLGGQESFRIRPLLDANAWAVVEAEAESLPPGTPVRVASRGHLEPLEIA